MSLKVNIKKVNAFTGKIDGGNPAGVSLETPDLTDEQMIKISRELNVSETAFVFPSENADYKLRFFTPSIEVDLCGHATIATFFTMGLEGIIKGKEQQINVKQETKAGVLPVNLYFKKGVIKEVMMTQGTPTLKKVDTEFSEISDVLNISVDEIDSSLPLQKVSTGLFTLPVCIKKMKTLRDMKPDFKKVEELCKKINVGSFHVFTFQTIERNSLYNARCFAPVYGVNEDPVTGTANGAVCSYLLENKIIKPGVFICEQGDIIGRPGRVKVDLRDNKVLVGGKARVVENRIFEF